jgi:hypothetical protein
MNPLPPPPPDRHHGLQNTFSLVGALVLGVVVLLLLLGLAYLAAIVIAMAHFGSNK